MEPMNLMIQISKKTERLSFYKKKVNWIHAITTFWVHWSAITVHHIETVSLQFYNPLKHTTTFSFDLFLKFVDQNTSGLLFPLSLSLSLGYLASWEHLLLLLVHFFTVLHCYYCHMLNKSTGNALQDKRPNLTWALAKLPKQGKTGTPSILNCRSFWQI